MSESAKESAAPQELRKCPNCDSLAALATGHNTVNWGGVRPDVPTLPPPLCERFGPDDSLEVRRRIRAVYAEECVQFVETVRAARSPKKESLCLEDSLLRIGKAC